MSLAEYVYSEHECKTFTLATETLEDYDSVFKVNISTRFSNAGISSYSMHAAFDTNVSI